MGDVPIRTHLNACGDELSTQLMRTTAVKGALILEDESANLYLQVLTQPEHDHNQDCTQDL